jgi:hypothetical protein
MKRGETRRRCRQDTVLADAGHFVFIDPQSEVWPQVVRSAKRLLIDAA